jgi:NADH-quinone oxidoreductase subunit M
MIYERRHTRAIDQYGGIAKVMPLFALCFVVSVLSSVGLPGLNGFVGEWMILMGSFQSSAAAAQWITAFATTGVIFGAIYLLSVTRRLLFGPVVHEANRRLPDLGMRELVTVVPLLLACLWIGLSPNGCLDRTASSTALVVERVEAARRSLAQAPRDREGRDESVAGLKAEGESR